MQCPKVPNSVNNECQIIRKFTQGGGRDQPQVIDVTNAAPNDPPQATPQPAETVSPN
jgi:hypothetical protein